jgi:hypothetical protein
MNVHGQFIISNVQVGGDVFLEGLECSDLVLRSSIFEGAFSAIGARVFALDALACQFSKAVNMNDLRCDASVGFTDCSGMALHFDRAKIGGTLGIGCREKIETTFHDLYCFGVNIGAQLILENTKLLGALVLESAHVTADFQMIDGYVLGSFSAMGCRIGGSFSFEHSLCGGPAEFTSFEVHEQFNVSYSVFLGDVRFWKLRAGFVFDCRKAEFEHGATFAGAELPGQVILYDLKSEDTLSFQDAKIGSLYFDRKLTKMAAEPAWPFGSIALNMTGCQYDRISVGWAAFARALHSDEHNTVDRQSYFQLEKFMRTIERNDWADEVYYRGRKAAGDRLPLGKEKLVDWLRRYVSGYGVRSRQLLLFVLVVIAFLTALFSIPGTSRPTIVSAAHYKCDEVPDFLDRIGLAVISVVPGAKVIDGWTISDCGLSFSGLSFGKPFLWVGIAQLAALILVPLWLATLTRVLKYGARYD